MRSSIRAVGDRVERGARLVHQHDVGLDRERAGDAEALLLTTREREAALLELVLHLVPQRGPVSACSTMSSMLDRFGR